MTTKSTSDLKEWLQERLPPRVFQQAMTNTYVPDAYWDVVPTLSHHVDPLIVILILRYTHSISEGLPEWAYLSADLLAQRTVRTPQVIKRRLEALEQQGIVHTREPEQADGPKGYRVNPALCPPLPTDREELALLLLACAEPRDDGDDD